MRIEQQDGSGYNPQPAKGFSRPKFFPENHLLSSVRVRQGGMEVIICLGPVGKYSIDE